MKPYIGDRDLDPPESEYECAGCGMYFGGHGTLMHHVQRCQKALLLASDDYDKTDDYDPED